MTLNKIKGFIKRETVLSVSLILALCSCLLTPPDAGYIGYINADTLIILFCLMCVTAGLSELGVFALASRAMLRRLHSERALVAALLALCFFGSMLITNDVALITFVPLALPLLDVRGRERQLCLAVSLMTAAANLGSMLTPIGNPQNLYLYSVSGMSPLAFVRTMLPYALFSALLLFGAAFLLFGKAPAQGGAEFEGSIDRRAAAFYAALFVLCAASVARALSVWVLLPVVAAAIFLKNRRLLMKVDYSLLATFVCFFVFVGNMGRFAPFRDAVCAALAGREAPVSAALCQIISNVPAALLLSGFTADTKALLIGVNIGGLGTLIASMASLISYKQLGLRRPDCKGRYFLTFTALNISLLAALGGFYFLIK